MDLHNATVLVVEDNIDSQEVVGRILRHLRIHTSVVSSSEEAIGLLEVQQYHLAVIDLALPQMDGWGLLDYIRQQPFSSTMPTIAVTAYHSPEVAVKAIEAGFDAYFPKPLDTSQFIRQLQDIITDL